MKNEHFGKYRSRLTMEAILKALLIGLSFGCGIACLVGFASWFFGFKAGLYLAIGLFVVITAVLTVILYSVKFRPTTKQIARRVDALGLEERVITMTELEGTDSYIANAQRADTMKALGAANHSLLKLAVTASMIVAVTVCGLFFAGSVTVGGLYAAAVIPDGITLIMGEPEQDKFIVDYSVARGTEGQILYDTNDWDHSQPFDGELVLYAGEDAPAVLAVPAQGWVFVNWSDGKSDPHRQDLNVGGNIVIVANFMRATLIEDDEDELPEEDKLEIPSSEDSGPPPSDDMDYERTKEGNQIEDGKHYYGDGYDDTTKESLGKMEANENIPDDMKKHISDYFDALNPGSGSGNGSGEGSGGGEGGGEGVNP